MPKKVSKKELQRYQEQKFKLTEKEKGNKELTAEEIKAGWHYCPDLDFMLIYPGCPDFISCTCEFTEPEEEKPKRKRGRPKGSKDTKPRKKYKKRKPKFVQEHPSRQQV